MSEPVASPTPAVMAGRRRLPAPVGPPPPATPFKTASDYPQRGLRDAGTWVDAGIFVSLGVRPELPDRFVALYGGWLQTARSVVGEIRNLSERSAEDAVRDAASAVRQALLLGGRERVSVRSLTEADLSLRDEVRQQLRGLSANPLASHRGEADLITLAVAGIGSSGAPQVLLSNDAGASVVADRRGVPTRHIGDVQREMACAHDELTPETLYSELEEMTAVSRLQARVRPRSADELACRRSVGGCAQCDPPDGAAP